MATIYLSKENFVCPKEKIMRIKLALAHTVLKEDICSIEYSVDSESALFSVQHEFIIII